MRAFESAADLVAAAGSELGHSEWHVVSQQLIDDFAGITGDRQWIHVDPARAAAGPFGTTVAHGFLTLALIPMLVRETFRVEAAQMAVNYGLDRVRFPAPLASGSEIRAEVRIRAVARDGTRVRVTSEVVVTARGAARPCCVAELVTLFIF
jgi:acyl dehydratase